MPISKVSDHSFIAANPSVVSYYSCYSLLTWDWIPKHTNNPPYWWSLSLLVQHSQESWHQQNSVAVKKGKMILKSIFIEPNLVTTVMSVNIPCYLRSNKSLMELKKHYPTVPWLNHWTFSLSHSHTAESDLDTLGLSRTHRSPVTQTDVLCEFWFPWHFGKISMLCLPWKYYRKPRVLHESPITAFGFLFTVEIMRQRHFPLIMNQFSANRPMWGISLYMKIPWFNKSASYAQSIKLNQNKDFNLPRLTQT